MVYTSVFHFLLFIRYSFFSFVLFPFFFCTAGTVTGDNLFLADGFLAYNFCHPL